MKKSARFPHALAIGALGVAPPAAAENLELYEDADTRQIYSEPGPNRVPLGKFRPVDQSQAGRAAEASRSLFNERLQIRGYLQTRYTKMLGGDAGINLWSDRSVGDEHSLGDADKNYLIRRARLVFQGDVGDRLSFYIQPDFASSSGTTGNVVQMRDAYGDVYLTTDRVHRLRVGQSKVPFGWENLQSSSNGLAPDRADALNSAVRDERDLGVFYYFTPKPVQGRFDEINKLGLKHSGNYGMFGLGMYNGQGANRGDRNDDQHVVARIGYPWKLANGQFFEAGVQAYRGEYVPSTAAYRAPGDVSRTPTIVEDSEFGYDDERVGVSAIWYPQPFGVQAEWNWGTTPGLDLATNSIVSRDLEGGYVQAMYRFEHRFGTFLPFIKWQHFDGASKAENNAPLNEVNDLEIGVEWQIAAPLDIGGRLPSYGSHQPGDGQPCRPDRLRTFRGRRITPAIAAQFLKSRSGHARRQRACPGQIASLADRATSRTDRAADTPAAARRSRPAARSRRSCRGSAPSAALTPVTAAWHPRPAVWLPGGARRALPGVSPCS